ncbi:PREDICTED: replication protein A 70 kDa DNA-binding subunit E-like [Ipomoea nil]|uniref:replication protein A 70 kDa DNA-binding subunit E-like n=1 Tax=Ipomoea nil TaxID=35883 RepID=UPI00090167AF|nr:PREDICTED: replication protein A 70 kDa DNA-binding subunit E-like [Ipomoea nil]
MVRAKPVIFTLWGKYAKGEGIELEKKLAAGKFPVIFAKKIEVTNYNGLSLTTRYGSIIDFDIATPKAEQLGQWALSNSVTLHSLILTNAFNDAYLKLADLSKEPFVTISNVKSSSIEGKRYCIYASIKIPTKVKNFYYIACDGCWKGTAHSLGDEFECSHCGNSKAIAKPRCMMSIELTETNDSLESALFGNIIEELLSLSAIELVDMDKKNETVDLQNIKEKLSKKTFKVELLCRKQNFRGSEQIKYSVISLLEEKSITTTKRLKRKLIYDDTDEYSISNQPSNAFADLEDDITNEKSKLLKLG